MEAYESLRTSALGAEAPRFPGLGILHRQGLAAWIRALEQAPHSGGDTADDGAAREDGDRVVAPSPADDLPHESSELTRLIAGIIVSIGMEHSHA